MSSWQQGVSDEDDELLDERLEAVERVLEAERMADPDYRPNPGRRARRYSLVRHEGMVRTRGQNRDWWEVMYLTKSGRLAKIATITQSGDEDEPYEVEVGTLRPETLMQSFQSVGDARRAAIKRWEKFHARG